MKRVHIYVTGDVQGIFFRANIRDRAIKLGLKGFVRNVDDNKIEAVFEGKEEAVNEILEFCKRGPPKAKVEDVKIKEEECKKEFNSFKILFS